MKEEQLFGRGKVEDAYRGGWRENWDVLYETIIYFQLKTEEENSIARCGIPPLKFLDREIPTASPNSTGQCHCVLFLELDGNTI